MVEKPLLSYVATLGSHRGAAPTCVKHDMLQRCMCACSWEPNSYGYHGDDGNKFHNSGKGEEYGPKYGTGDIVGAGMHFGKQEIFFT